MPESEDQKRNEDAPTAVLNVLHELDVRINGLNRDGCHCNLVAEVVLNVLKLDEIKESAYRAGREDEARSQAAKWQEAIDATKTSFLDIEARRSALAERESASYEPFVASGPAEHELDVTSEAFEAGRRAGREDAARDAGLTCQENGDGLWPPADHFHECVRERGHRSRTHRCRCNMEWQLVDQPAMVEDTPEGRT